ncbi:MAG: UDP-N-acetylmuramoyl-L-alanyl-D-glutamate--2,6-diaminopimelate ligase [Gammaproteobacteria bacterium]|jgi:UDP-N-acetylmuramoyl-L-alanyl-D-glutamate--2,6-diaminopimelate ligase|nr:UDP-N-acetylmuramoyl-L-alanyl-D-glutamate--2,6-diaminopimelate ligase [Gammaproteobacteria bacterium]
MSLAPSHSMRRSLASLVDTWIRVPDSIYVDDLTLDSRKIKEHSLFLACQGRRAHGLDAVSQALTQGVRAILWEPAEGVKAPASELLKQYGVFAAALPELSRHAGDIAARFFDNPSHELKVCGITGTNGKTTTAWLLAKWFDALGLNGAYMGTLGVGRLTQPIESASLTTADAVQVQRQLASLKARGAEHIAMEISSHAIDQARVSAVNLQVAVFTNLSRDHLDYHGSMQAYADCKSRLFAWPNLRARVLNLDDALGRKLAAQYAARADGARMFLFARTAEGAELGRQLVLANAGVQMVHATDWQASPDGLQIGLQAHTHDAVSARQSMRVSLVGDFNIDNVLAAMAVLCSFDISLEAIIAHASAISAPPGRMEAQTGPGKPLVLVDYAHTPDALVKALAAARAHCHGALYVVFGCGGERDRGKRALMGEVAAQAADHIILTDDNPRGESPHAIVEDILQGVHATGVSSPQVIHDRRAAIVSALTQAREGDVVLVAGKGHEDYQWVGNERLAASDRLWVREALSV